MNLPDVEDDSVEDEDNMQAKELVSDGYKLDEWDMLDPTDAEIDYMREKVNKKHGTSVPFAPKEFKDRDLEGLRPEIARNTQGLQETVEAKMRKEAGLRWGEYTHELDFAKRLLSGELVMFEDDEHKARVLDEASRHLVEEKMRKDAEAAEAAEEERGDKGQEERSPAKALDESYVPEPIDFEPVGLSKKGMMMDKFVRGSYMTAHEKAGPRLDSSKVPLTTTGAGVGDGMFLAAIQAKTRLNETFTPRDQSRFVDKIKKVFEGSGVTLSGAEIASGGNSSRRAPVSGDR